MGLQGASLRSLICCEDAYDNIEFIMLSREIIRAFKHETPTVTNGYLRASISSSNVLDH
jgi:hypothetical protein